VANMIANIRGAHGDRVPAVADLEHAASPGNLPVVAMLALHHARMAPAVVVMTAIAAVMTMVANMIANIRGAHGDRVPAVANLEHAASPDNLPVVAVLALHHARMAPAVVVMTIMAAVMTIMAAVMTTMAAVMTMVDTTVANMIVNIRGAHGDRVPAVTNLEHAASPGNLPVVAVLALHHARMAPAVVVMTIMAAVMTMGDTMVANMIANIRGAHGDRVPAVTNLEHAASPGNLPVVAVLALHHARMAPAMVINHPRNIVQ